MVESDGQLFIKLVNRISGKMIVKKI